MLFGSAMSPQPQEQPTPLELFPVTWPWQRKTQDPARVFHNSCPTRRLESGQVDIYIYMLVAHLTAAHTLLRSFLHTWP